MVTVFLYPETPCIPIGPVRAWQVNLTKEFLGNYRGIRVVASDEEDKRRLLHLPAIGAHGAHAPALREAARPRSSPASAHPRPGWAWPLNVLASARMRVSHMVLYVIPPMPLTLSVRRAFQMFFSSRVACSPKRVAEWPRAGSSKKPTSIHNSIMVPFLLWRSRPSTDTFHQFEHGPRQLPHHIRQLGFRRGDVRNAVDIALQRRIELGLAYAQLLQGGVAQVIVRDRILIGLLFILHYLDRGVAFLCWGLQAQGHPMSIVRGCRISGHRQQASGMDRQGAARPLAAVTGDKPPGR